MNNSGQPTAKQRWRIAYRLGRVCQGPLADIPYGFRRQVEAAIRGAHVAPPMTGRILCRLRFKREQERWGRHQSFNCRCVVVPIN